MSEAYGDLNKQLKSLVEMILIEIGYFKFLNWLNKLTRK